MLENKTANNIVDRYHRIITGDQSQIEMNANKVVTVNGTLGNPFGDLDIEELFSALSMTNPQATALISFTYNDILVTDYLFKDGDAGFAANAIQVLNGAQLGIGFLFMWEPNGTVEALYSILGSSVVDMTALAANIPCTLTVIYHPVN